MESVRTNEKSLGSLFRELTEDLSTLVRSEIALAKHEVKQTFVSLGGATVLFASALFAGFCAAAFLLVTIVLVLALFIPSWVAALIVTLVLFGAAVLLALGGRKKLRNVRFVPEDTIENVKTDVASIKREITARKGGA